MIETEYEEYFCDVCGDKAAVDFNGDSEIHIEVITHYSDDAPSSMSFSPPVDLCDACGSRWAAHIKNLIRTAPVKGSRPTSNEVNDALINFMKKDRESLNKMKLQRVHQIEAIEDQIHENVEAFDGITKPDEDLNIDDSVFDDVLFPDDDEEDDETGDKT